jgi:acetyl-CoA C-acetyltransferase
MLPRNVYVLSHSRTPIGSFLSSLAPVPASHLASVAIEHAVSAARIEKSDVNLGIIGQVVTAGCGQAPARQAMLGASLSPSTEVFSVNKVCSSGMKSICLGASSIALGESRCVVAGGMESMSNIPHVLRSGRLGGQRLGSISMDDLVVTDGLWDVYNNIHMGTCAEKTVGEFGISRQTQDEYALESYKRANEAWSSGRIVEEIVPVRIQKDKKSFLTIDKDEEISNLRIEKVATLKPSFKDNGTITPANASKLNDGASAVILGSEEFVKSNNLKPMAKIVAYADFSTDPINFSIAPKGAIDLALRRANLSVKDIDFWEINEAFSCVPIVNSHLLKIDLSRVNVDGGAVALGHPIGASGSRIVGTLARILKQRGARFGCAAICNGGGGSTAIVLENLS